MAVIDLRVWPDPHYAHYKYMMFMLPITLGARVIVETGFQDGASTRIFLNSLEQLSGERLLYTIEFTQNTDSEDTIKLRKEMVVQLQQKYGNGLYQKHPVGWRYIYQDSVDAGRNWFYQKIDFLYLDSDHKTEHVYNELNEWSRHLSDKAIIMVDDAFNYDKYEPTGPMIAAQKWMDGQHKSSNWKMLTFTEKHGPIVMYR
jgi:hypothetical protein